MSGDAIVVHVDADLEDLIPGFLERRREDLETMRAALVSGDLETLRVKGHSMKGTGGGYGFDGLSEIGARIEADARRGDVGDMGAHLDALADYLARVRIEYR